MLRGMVGGAAAFVSRVGAIACLCVAKIESAGDGRVGCGVWVLLFPVNFVIRGVGCCVRRFINSHKVLGETGANLNTGPT